MQVAGTWLVSHLGSVPHSWGRVLVPPRQITESFALEETLVIVESNHKCTGCGTGA